MAEEYHTTCAAPEPTTYPPRDPGEPTLFPEHVARWAREDRAALAATIEDFSVRAALLTACDHLQAATEEYATASAMLDEATIALHEARMQLAFAEDTETARLLPTIVARNAEERKAALADVLWATEVVDEARTHRDSCLAAHTRAEGRFRVADRTCKDLNRRLAALTALVGQP